MSDESRFFQLVNPAVDANPFRALTPEDAPPPAFADVRGLLPEPRWEGHEAAIACYWKTWELLFRSLRRPTPANGFVANYVDSAFHGNLFMWDSVFILFFAHYARRIFDPQRTLDNFYARQEPDGFICKEFRGEDGSPRFERFDPCSTGPNLLAWSEWEHYRRSGDRRRLADVFPVLVAYHQWLRSYRTWQDGSYWTNGIGSGMDNQPRAIAEPGDPWSEWRRPPYRRELPPGWAEDISWLHHGHLTWVDATLQQLLSARLLRRIAAELGRAAEVPDMEREAAHLAGIVNGRLWDEASGFLYDARPGGTRSDVKTIGAFWALLADALPPERRARLIAQLENPATFSRPHRVPSLAADHPQFHPGGGYWLGGVWPPTNYMVLRGLTEVGEDALAHTIARNHHGAVVATFEQTGTVWENYAPEQPTRGNASQPDFVGWGGLGPIAVLLEYVFGLRPDVPARRLVWDVRLLDGHGVVRYPFGPDGLVDLWCAPRSNAAERPQISARSTSPLTLEIRWAGGVEERAFAESLIS